jgi:hypothetical protein
MVNLDLFTAFITSEYLITELQYSLNSTEIEFSLQDIFFTGCEEKELDDSDYTTVEYYYRINPFWLFENWDSVYSNNFYGAQRPRLEQFNKTIHKKYGSAVYDFVRNYPNATIQLKELFSVLDEIYAENEKKFRRS